MNQSEILSAVQITLAGLNLIGSLALLARLRRPKTPNVQQLVNASGSRKIADLIKDQAVLHEFAKVAVEAAEARYGAKSGQDKARFARQSVMDHAAAIGCPCTGIQADALIHSHLK